MLLAANTQCVEQAVALCAQLGPIGPVVFMVATIAMAAFERWRRGQTERKAEEKLAAVQAAADEKLAKAKAERNEHAAARQALEVKVAVAESLRPPPMSSSSSSPSNPPVELVGAGGDTD